MNHVIYTLLFSLVMQAQDLGEHLWKHRVIVIQADKANATLADTQFNSLLAENSKLKERKLVVYKCIGDYCAYYNGSTIAKVPNTITKPKGFNVKLLGLDGGEKHSSAHVEKAKVFFDLIDAMPMRLQELKNKKK